MIERIISFVKPYTTYPSHEDIKYRGEMVQWLRDLKDKCLPLSKQEWSEEDEKMLTNAIAACNQCYFPKTTKWLKSLCPQKML